jgi:hypothetical protein
VAVCQLQDLVRFFDEIESFHDSSLSGFYVPIILTTAVVAAPAGRGSGTILTAAASSMTRSIGVVTNLVVYIVKPLSRGSVVTLG